MSTFAGSGAASFADGTGLAASFNTPKGITVDTGGNLYVADTLNHRVRMITQAGVVTTVAGSGVAGYADGFGTSAQLNQPTSLDLDPQGNIFVCDNGNYLLRLIVPSSNDYVATIAGQRGVPGSADGVGTAATLGTSNSWSNCALRYDFANDRLVFADLDNNKIRTVRALFQLPGRARLGGVARSLCCSGSICICSGRGPPTLGVHPHSRCSTGRHVLPGRQKDQPTCLAAPVLRPQVSAAVSPITNLTVSSAGAADTGLVPSTATLLDSATATSAYIAFPATALPSAGAVCLSGFGTTSTSGTFAVWVYTAQAIPWARVFDLGLGSSSAPCTGRDINNWIFLTITGDGATARFAVNSGSVNGFGGFYGSVDVPAFFTPGQWAHMAVTVSAAGVWNVFLNGAVVSANVAARPLPIWGAMYSAFLGRSQFPVNYDFNGAIAAFQVRACARRRSG